MNILPDGSIQGQTFSGNKYKGEYPSPKKGESYADYRGRVKLCIENGFHLGDLSNYDWQLYCMGSGNYDGVDSGAII